MAAAGPGRWVVYVTARSSAAGRTGHLPGTVEETAEAVTAGGGYERLNAGAWQEWNAPFWEQPLELFDAMFGGGVRTHYVATAVCAPLLIATPGSLVGWWRPTTAPSAVHRGDRLAGAHRGRRG